MSSSIYLQIAQVTTGLETSIVAQFGDQVYTLMNQVKDHQPVYYPLMIKSSYYYLKTQEDLATLDCYSHEMPTAFPASSWLTTSRAINAYNMTLHHVDLEFVQDLRRIEAQEEIPF